MNEEENILTFKKPLGNQIRTAIHKNWNLQ